MDYAGPQSLTAFSILPESSIYSLFQNVLIK